MVDTQLARRVRLLLAGVLTAVAAALASSAVFSSEPNAMRVVADTCAAGYDLDVYNLQCIPEISPGPPSQQLLTVCSGGSRNDCLRENFYDPGGVPWVDVPEVDTSVRQNP